MDMPADLTQIGEAAFENIAAVRAEIPDTCTAIGSRAFAGCTMLHYIYIPDSVTEIAEDAFEGCPEELLLYCSEDSAAYEFAAEHGLGVIVTE